MVATFSTAKNGAKGAAFRARSLVGSKPNDPFLARAHNAAQLFSAVIALFERIRPRLHPLHERLIYAAGDKVIIRLQARGPSTRPPRLATQNARQRPLRRDFCACAQAGTPARPHQTICEPGYQARTEYARFKQRHAKRVEILTAISFPLSSREI